MLDPRNIPDAYSIVASSGPCLILVNYANAVLMYHNKLISQRELEHTSNEHLLLCREGFHFQLQPVLCQPSNRNRGLAVRPLWLYFLFDSSRCGC